MDTKSSGSAASGRRQVETVILDFKVNDASAGVTDTADVFEEDYLAPEGKVVPGYPSFRYVPFGGSDDLPHEILRHIGMDEVLSQNLLFNVLTAYGSGVEYTDPETNRPTKDPEICGFMRANSLKRFYLEQCTDMKHFFFSVAVIVLNRKRDRIVQVRHKDACFCRFEKANSSGKVCHLFYANWNRTRSLGKKDVEMLELLDERDPLGDLRVKLGLDYGIDGVRKVRTSAYKFAVVMRFPTPGNRYYPMPYYTSLFRGDWFDIKRLIGKGKKAKIRNHAAIRYQVEVHADYWEQICERENITDPVEKEARIKKEQENIRDFVTGIHNSGKVWITGYYVDAYGHEVHMVKISVIDTGKEGGDWSEDTQEASNMLCYGTNIHPNLVGAVPGKSQSNNSGSDKRELFTLKQSLETAFRDMLLGVHELIIWFNGWQDKAVPTVPMVLLTTLDKGTDAKSVNPKIS